MQKVSHTKGEWGIEVMCIPFLLSFLTSLLSIYPFPLTKQWKMHSDENL